MRRSVFIISSRRALPLAFLALLFVTPASAQEEQPPSQLIAFYKELYANIDEASTQRPRSDSVLTLLGRWPWGPCVAVAAQGNYAYITNGPMFQVLDVSDPATPTIVGEYEAPVSDIFVRDSLAFLAVRGLLILDISDPTSPRQVSELPLSSGVRRVVVEGDFAYVLTAPGQLRVIDIGNVSAPYLRGQIAAGGDLPRSLAVRNGYAYVGNLEFNELLVVNATNPDSLTGTYVPGTGSIVSLHAADSLLYVGRALSFRVYSISSLSTPVYLGHLTLGRSVNAITADGAEAYVTTEAGIYAIDASNPLQPLVVDSLSPTSTAVRMGLDIAVESGCIFSAQTVGMWVVRRDSLTERSYFRTGDQATRVLIKDHLAYVADGQGGLWIVDISNPAMPQGIGNMNTGSYTCDVVVAGSIAYVVNCPLPIESPGSGVWIVDISDPYNPNPLSHYPGIVRYSGTHSNSIALVGNLLFLSQTGGAAQDSTLEIIDVRNPVQPSRVSVFTSPHRAYYVAAKESIACLATPSGGLRIVDWSIPAVPVEIAAFQNSIRGIALADTFAFAARSDTFFVLSVGNPAQPTLLGKYGRMSAGGFTSANVFAEHPFVYWAAAGSLGVIDVSDPTNPRSLTVIQGGLGVTAADRVVLAANGIVGLSIYRNERITSVQNDEETAAPSEHFLHQNYPNPFNSSTSIRFSIPNRSRIILEVFDILGRRIETLLDTVGDAGEHTAVWDATSRSSGVYLYRLTSGAATVTRPMLFIK